MEFRTILGLVTLFMVAVAEVPYEPFVDRALDHENVCKQPIQSGMCMAYFPRYGYNSETKKCQRFVYGGCGANLNNFQTEDACKRVCVDKQPCPIPSLQKPRQGCRYNEEPNEKGCPKYELVCDVKPGLCPTDHEKAHVKDACVFECSHSDDRCPGEKKCCKIGCNIICVPPAPANQ